MLRRLYLRDVVIVSQLELSLSPAGQMSRLAAEKDASTYSKAYEEAAWRVTAGDRVF